MSAIKFDSRFTDQQERELIRREMNVFPLRSASVTPGELAATGPEKALMVFKGALIVAGVVFVTIAFALQAAARFA